MKKYTKIALIFFLGLVNLVSVQAQTEVKNKFLDTLRLGIRYQVQEFHTLNQKLSDNCNCDESLPLKERALQGISVSLFEPLTDHWSVGADLGGSFGKVIDDDRNYKNYSFVQMRAESFYHLFDAKTRLRPYLSASIQLAANQQKALFSLPLGAGLRYKLNKGGYLHVQTAYDRGFGHAIAKNMITNVGFHVPLFRAKSSKLTGSNLYPANTNNSAGAQWSAQAKTAQAVNPAINPVESPTPVSNTQLANSAAAPKQLVRVIYFDTDRNSLNKSETAKIMAEVLAFMAENKDAKVYLSGHTDNIQSEAYNLRLSKNRVDATISQLMKDGITSDRIDGKHYGESSPIASNKYESGRATNRRVEIVVR
jgi:outer membrane protein OmpA-like peptidoglycan-associated protein